MKQFLAGFIFFVSILSTKAQAPNWSVNTRNYEFSMIFTAVLNVNGNRLTNTNDQVGAFVGDEIRGVGNVSYDATDDKYVVFFRVYANTTGETINFRIYDSTNDMVVNVPKTTVFNIDERVGGVFQSYSIASPTLSNTTNLIDFSFQGITETSKNINGTTFTFLLPQGTNVTALIPVFSLPANARLFKGFVRQESGVSTISFSNDVVYTVLSADETTTQNYTVSVAVSGGSGRITTNLQSANSSITNNKIITIDLSTSLDIVEVNKDDFNVTNCVVKSINQQNNRLFTIEIVPINQGNVSVQVNENSLLDANGNLNSASNVLAFTFDSFSPIISAIIRNNPIKVQTGANAVTFTIIFNEAVENVSANDFSSVAGASINLTKQSETVYSVTITNINEYEGIVAIATKSTNGITDKALNKLRISNQIDF